MARASVHAREVDSKHARKGVKVQGLESNEYPEETYEAHNTSADNYQQEVGEPEYTVA